MARPRPFRPARAALLALALAVGAAPACGKSEPAVDAGTSAPTVLDPIPAPPGLVAELCLPAPEVTWGKARGLVGGPAAFLPATFGGLVATLLGLPITSATEIDGAIPVVGAAVDDDRDGGKPAAGVTPRRARVSVAIHVKAGDRLVDQLTKGDTARYAARVDESTRIVFLDPKGSARPEAPPSGPRAPTSHAFGVLGNYLLVGPSEADVLAAGPYAARTLSTRPAPREDVAVELPAAAMRGPVKRWLDRVGAALSDERAPLGVATSTMLAPMRDLLAVAGDLDRGRMTVELGDTVRMRVLATPQGGGGAATGALEALAVGDAEPLLALPATTLVGGVIRDSEQARGQAVTRQIESLTALLGPDKAGSDKDREALGDVLGALAKARGDWIAGGVSFGPTGPVGFGRAALRDGDAGAKGMRALVDLTGKAPLKTILTDAGVSVTKGKVKVDGAGDAVRLRLERSKDDKATRDPTLPVAVEILYAVAKDALVLAAGEDAKEALAAAARAPADPAQSLAGNPQVKSMLEALGSDVAFAVFVEPLRYVAVRAGKPGAGESAPVVVAAGRTADGAERGFWLRADAAPTAVRELLKHAGAL